MQTCSGRLRWMIRADRDAVVAIERHSFEYPWSKEDFVDHLGQSNVIGIVVCCGDDVVGYIVYELHKTYIHVLNIAVHRDYRRNGMGQMMLSMLKQKMSGVRRNTIIIEVRETNLDAQFFFRSEGFRVVSILRNFYSQTDEDAYLFQYKV